MDKFFVFGDKEYRMLVSDGRILSINGQSVKMEIMEIEGGEIEIKIGQKLFKAEILDHHQNRYLVQINGNTYPLIIESMRSKRRKEILERNNGHDLLIQVVAPMPGKVTEVLVEVGQEIQRGTPLVILEAMKMENEIIAPRDGKVIQINVQANMTVMQEDLLLELKKI